MVATSDQSTQEGLPEYSWIAKLGEARKTKREEKPETSLEASVERTYVLEGPKVVEGLKGIFGDKKIVDINTGNTLDLDGLLEGIKDSNVRLLCYESKLGEVDYHSPNGVLYAHHGKIGLSKGYVAEDLARNTLYLVLKRKDSRDSYHLVIIREEVPLEDILELTEKYKLERGGTIVAKCESACKEPNKLELVGFAYVDENGNIDICGLASYLNVKLNRLPIPERK